MPHSFLRLGAPLALAGLVLVGCGQSASEGPGSDISVKATDTTCELSATTAPVGPVTFTVTNSGTKVTEFYVYEGERVVSEVENIAPGLSRDLEVDFTEPGTYTTACKPGMSGDGIRADFTVTRAASTPGG